LIPPRDFGMPGGDPPL